MAQVTVCDRCDHRIVSNETKFAVRIDNMTLDLCQDCYRAVQELLSSKPQNFNAEA
jgi:ribosome-binding protein aMBF1 (putative translation factor)